MPQLLNVTKNLGLRSNLYKSKEEFWQGSPVFPNPDSITFSGHQPLPCLWSLKAHFGA
jgi:hypothetical protein